MNSQDSYMQKHDMLYTSVLADGRLMHRLAQSALKHGKKDLSIEMAAYVDGKLPLGWNDDDLEQAVKSYLGRRMICHFILVLISLLVASQLQTKALQC